MSACKRAWEVEAARDGRLSGDERLSMERHLSSCAECAREQLRLEALATALRNLPVVAPDELRVRRQRQELLAHAYEAQTRVEGPRQRTQRRRGAVLALCACAALVWLFWPRGEATPAAKLALRPSMDANFTRQTSAAGDVVDLKQGRLTLEVQRVDRQRGVLVRTPDGEIEDIGTVFTVVVDAGRTQIISVSKGSVVARIAGQPERRIMAGEMHRPYEGKREAPAPSTTSPATVKATRARPAHVRHDTPATDASAVAETVNEPARDATGPRQMSESEAAAKFALAVARVEAHDDARAIMLLQDFIAQFPSDARAEDATFLRVVVLARGADTRALGAAARTYLAKYPHGFRAPEVLRLVDSDAAL